MAKLLLGPLLRYVGETEAVIWVETDEECEVEVLGHTEQTFCVCGHHYALVIVDGLEPGSTTGTRSRSTATGAGPSPTPISPRASSARSAATDAAALLRLLPGLASPPRAVHAAEERPRRRARVRRALLADQGDARATSPSAGRTR